MVETQAIRLFIQEAANIDVLQFRYQEVLIDEGLLDCGNQQEDCDDQHQPEL